MRKICFLSASFWLLIVLAGNAYAARIGILSALPQELKYVKQETKELKTRSIGRSDFFTGRIGEISVVLTLSGMGKVNAAVAAQRLISEFSVRAILFTGVAGGIDDSFEIGDVVLGKEAFQHDFGFLGQTFKIHRPGALPEIGIGTGDEKKEYDLTKWPVMESGEQFFTFLQKRIQGMRPSFEKVKVDNIEYAPKFGVGVIATGDQFISQDAKNQELWNLGADLVEMEGASVAQVAYENDMPCLILRSISDKAGHEASIDFSTFFEKVAKNNAGIVTDLLRDEAVSSYFRNLN